MDKQTFCSSQTTSNTSRYAAALYRQGTLGSALGCHGFQGLREWEAGWGWGRKGPALAWCPVSLPPNASQAACANNRLSQVQSWPSSRTCS